ncbi:MAG: hypothetical protein KAW17_09660 [Candidatus Eisenbacteria sp.]|nr:hypothetical protein [Candidatus Eisenbacteria bacterium]
MRTEEVVAVEFEIYDRGTKGRIPREWVPIEEAVEFGTVNNAIVTRVRWNTGGESWAKNWSKWDAARGLWVLVRIGAGSEGQRIVLEV